MGDVNKKDIYVQISLKAIRNGEVFNTVNLDYPTQSEVSYTMMEKGLMELLASWGDAALKAALPEAKPGPAK